MQHGVSPLVDMHTGTHTRAGRGGFGLVTDPVESDTLWELSVAWSVGGTKMPPMPTFSTSTVAYGYVAHKLAQLGHKDGDKMLH